jgi:hypothetical protein
MLPTPDKPVLANKKQKGKEFRKPNSKRIYFKRKFDLKVGGPLPPPEPGCQRLKVRKWVWKPIGSPKIPSTPEKPTKSLNVQEPPHSTRLDSPQKVEPKKEVEKEVDESGSSSHATTAFDFSSVFSAPAVSQKPAKENEPTKSETTEAIPEPVAEKKPTKPETTEAVPEPVAEKKPTKPKTAGQITPSQPGTTVKAGKTVSRPVEKVKATKTRLADKIDTVKTKAALKDRPNDVVSVKIASVPKQAAPDTEEEIATPVPEVDGGEGDTATEIGSVVDHVRVAHRVIQASNKLKQLVARRRSQRSETASLNSVDIDLADAVTTEPGQVQPVEESLPTADPATTEPRQLQLDTESLVDIQPDTESPVDTQPETKESQPDEKSQPAENQTDEKSQPAEKSQPDEKSQPAEKVPESSKSIQKGFFANMRTKFRMVASMTKAFARKKGSTDVDDESSSDGEQTGTQNFTHIINILPLPSNIRLCVCVYVCVCV